MGGGGPGTRMERVYYKGERTKQLAVLGTTQKVEDAIQVLKKKALIEEYPPLCEKKGVRIAQKGYADDIAETVTPKRPDATCLIALRRESPLASR